MPHRNGKDGRETAMFVTKMKMKKHIIMEIKQKKLLVPIFLEFRLLMETH